MSNCPSGRSGCKGHKHFHGGSMDGYVACLTAAHPSDYPERFATMKRHGQRSWYVRDHAYPHTTGTEVYYRFVGHFDEWPADNSPELL